MFHFPIRCLDGPVEGQRQSGAGHLASRAWSRARVRPLRFHVEGELTAQAHLPVKSFSRSRIASAPMKRKYSSKFCMVSGVVKPAVVPCALRYPAAVMGHGKHQNFRISDEFLKKAVFFIITPPKGKPRKTCLTI